MRELILGGLTYLTAAVDGADQESYEVYRRGGNFELVMENLRTLVRLKRELGSATPHLCWQYLVFAHNEDRIEDARRLATELGLDAFGVKGGLYEDAAWAPKGDYNFGYLSVHPNRCVWLWNKAVSHWDGGLASCCMGFYKHDDFAHWSPGSSPACGTTTSSSPRAVLTWSRNQRCRRGTSGTDCNKVRFFRKLPLETPMKPSRGVARRDRRAPPAKSS